MSYTFWQHSGAEKLLQDVLDAIAGELKQASEGRQIRSVVLAGGYGRGEGGVTPDGGLYNDLDFLVICRDGIDSSSLRPFFQQLSRKWEEKLQIDIDFFLVPEFQWLYRNAHTLMMQELLAGHVVIFGETAVLASVPRLPWEQLPWREGARLLLNRGTGLLLSRRALGEPLQKDFISRNLQKAVLGAGDAWLIAKHQYCRSGIERLEILKRTSTMPELAEWYEDALRYKYAPGSFKPGCDSAALERVQQLWLTVLVEFARAVTGQEVSGPELAAVVLSRGGLADAGSYWRNALLSCCYGRLCPEIIFPLREHPRLKMLCPLVRILQCPNTRQEERYLQLWRRFN